MKLIEWSELSDGQLLLFGHCRRKRRLDPVGEVRGAIVFAHSGSDIGHKISKRSLLEVPVGRSSSPGRHQVPGSLPELPVDEIGGDASHQCELIGLTRPDLEFARLETREGLFDQLIRGY